jgi:sporulation protein YlmC with PRC-barrel domain
VEAITLNAVRTLTEFLGRPVAGPDGRTLGRPNDVIADGSRTPPVVTGVVVKGRRLSWPSLQGTATGDLLLMRDVMDVRVLDRQGHHRGCVGDIQLEPDSDGELRVVAVETGLRPVLKRLGLGRLAQRATFETIPWADLHPLAGRTHAFTAELPNRPQRFRSVMHARRRAPR